MSFHRTYVEALAHKLARPQKPRKLLRSRTSLKRGTKQLKRSRMKQRRQSPEEKALCKEVLKRDGNRCQWPGGCATGDSQIDVHHLAERSQRPDLKLSAANCKAICRTHHDWIPLHREEAIEMGLLNPETYEHAMKKASEDARLMEVASGFREGILQGRSSERMCIKVSFPLQGYLSALEGVETEMIEGEVNGMGHFWLELADGRILDATADQFTKPNGEPMPEVYLGDRPAWYGDAVDPADDEIHGETYEAAQKRKR